MLGNTSSVTREQIEECVNQVLQMPNFRDCDSEQIIREIESIYRVRVEDYRIIEREERRLPWLNAKRAEINWGFWTRYRSYLQDEKNFPPDTLNKLDRLTDRILDSLFDPTANIQIDKRGMVVGQVQSGKTANYTGLICKAVDAGFKLIIVLTGIHENLRSQTQLRLDEGFLGFDTRNSRAFDLSVTRIGVGNYGNPNCIAHSITSSEHRADFNAARFNSLGINFNTLDPILIVTKKNASILENLGRWLSLQTDSNDLIHNKSLLLIDDEADNASINTNRADRDPTTINRRIREILSSFRKSAYVGYTATPFANIFIPIEEDNLFPRDFIVNIPPPSNYIGPEKIFGFSMVDDDEESETVLPIVNRIDDYITFVPDRHRKRDYPDWNRPEEVAEDVIEHFHLLIPDSLKKAIKCFILSCAIRRLRGQTTAHNSMLIHITRFKNWQSIVTAAVQREFDYYRMGIDQNDTEIINQFRSTFENDQPGYKSYTTVTNQIIQGPLSTLDSNLEIHSWNEVLQVLNDAASIIEVKAIHGGSGEALDYYDHRNGLSVIAIGGNKLSRGLTLEGLTVSYYLRSSRMYDTLMQMGRWFGYRAGYLDLCRLFTSRELNEWFCHITHASEELREEFDYMSDVAGSTPEQYALRVRTHPGVLQISATNKLRSATTVNISHAGRLVESYEFKKDIEVIEGNLQNTKSYIESLPSNYQMVNNNFVWFDRPADEIINFLGGHQSLENLKAYDPQNLIRFIRNQLPNGELTHWRVAMMSKRNAVHCFDFRINSRTVPVGSFVRQEDENNSDNNVYYLRKSHIISPKDEFLDLTSEEYELALQLTREHRARQNKEGEPAYPNGEIVRNQIRETQKPLLIIYLLDTQLSLTKYPLLNCTYPFVGYAISFPRSDYSAFVSYAVNEQLLDRFNIDDNLDDFDDDED